MIKENSTNKKQEDLNFKLLEEYIQFKKQAENISEKTANSYKYILSKFIRTTNKPLNFISNITENDVLKFLENYGFTSRGNVLCKIKIFARHIHQLDKDDKLPNSLRRIKNPTKRQLGKQQAPTDEKKIITSEELSKLIEKGSTHVMDKALVETLFLFGCRPGEIISMNTGDVKEDTETGITSIIVRDSKTLPREIPTNENPQFLLDWCHVYNPNKNKPNKPLWISKSNRNRDKRITANGVWKIIKRMTKTAKINRNIFPYILRHTSITIARQNEIPTTHLESKYGWIHGTQMLRNYDHNNTNDFKKYLIKTNKKTPRTYGQLDKQNKTLEEKHEKEIKELKEELEITMNTVKMLCDDKEFNDTYKDELEYKKDREQMKDIIKLLKENKQDEIIKKYGEK